MPAPATLRRLSTNDLAQIREMLAAGRKPKVVFTEAAGQIAGQVGQVIELIDPDATEEWIVVRFGRDELPFSPADLAIPPKSTPARRPDPKSPVVTLPAPREEKPAASRQDPVIPPPAPTPPAPSPPAPGPTGARPVKAGKPKAPASLTVTLAYTDREWTVAANQGSKALAKPYVIRPADALRMVSILDVPGVHEAVENIIAVERAEAEGRAQRLRAELAEIESRLSELANSD